MQIPEAIEVRDSLGNPKAYLLPDEDGLKEVWVSDRLNAECTLSFLLPITCAKWDEITPECRLRTSDKEFVILRPDVIDVERTEEGKTFGRLTAQENWVLLDKEFVTVSNDPQNPEPADLQVAIISGGAAAGGYPQGSAGSAMTYLLQGSEWTLAVCDVTGTHDLETEKLSRLENIKEVQEIWGGYLVWDSLNKTVSLRSGTTWQPYNGFQIRHTKNMKDISRTANYDIVTRLYAFGSDDLDISSVNGGVKYVEDFTYTNSVYYGIFQDQDIDDPTELKAKAEEALAKLCQPRYTYKTKVLDLSVLPDYAHESLSKGDLVDVIDEDLGFNVQVRVIDLKRNEFKPWLVELEIGEPEERLAEKLSSSFDQSDFIKNVLKPNRATSNLLKGFISTFATTINSANGKLVWDDSTLEAIEVDQNGDETGKRVRLTPGGIGISIDSGQTYVVALTGDGILANRIIVNELYAIVTDDGFTKLMDSGLHVFDESEVERVVVGWWMDGEIKKYGIKIIDPGSMNTILDQNGILQSWQEGRNDNVDSTHPLVINIYVPAETKNIKKALLRFKRQKFRAYETGAASGGGQTSGSSSSSTTNSQNEDITINTYRFISGVSADYTVGAKAAADTHNHGISSGTKLLIDGGGYVTYSAFSGANHVHDLYNHGHEYTANGHSHGMSHTHQVYSHTHDISYGIYEDVSLATGITVKINGTDRTLALGGGTGFTTDQNGLNIASYLTSGTWNTIELTPTNRSRIDATIFIQAMMGV